MTNTKGASTIFYGFRSAEPNQGEKPVEEFLKSKSMLTPGMAGAFTTMITATLVTQFGLPGALTGLVVSFVLGLLAWADTRIPPLQRLLIYVINSMTIFTVAVGINEAGVAINKSEERITYEKRWVPPESEANSFFQRWF